MIYQLTQIIVHLIIKTSEGTSSMQSKQQVTEEQITQFIVSIKSGSLDQIDQYLQKYGSDITNRMESQLRQPPLYFAINLPDDSTCLNVMRKLVNKGANPKFKDQNDQTIIFYACRDGKIQCVNYLTELGVSLYQQDAYGQTPLYYIASQNQLHLLPKYNKIQYFNHTDKLAHQTPLYYAAKKGNLQMCKALIQRGCDVTHHDSHNKTSVQYARRARYHEVTQYLSNEVKKAREIKLNPPKEVPVSKPQQQSQSKKIPKKQIETESVANVPKSFYKIVYINDQGETKDLTEQDIRNLIKQKPGLQSILANPSSISKQALQNEKAQQQNEKWQKVATKILTVCWKHKGSVWFQQPVDPVKFGIMDYNDIITHPMDLGTIKKKLAHNFYSSPQEFSSDVRLVWQNCYKYNGYEHEISYCAKQLEALFQQQYNESLKPFVDNN